LKKEEEGEASFPYHNLREKGKKGGKSKNASEKREERETSGAVYPDFSGEKERKKDYYERLYSIFVGKKKRKKEEVIWKRKGGEQRQHCPVRKKKKGKRRS